MPTSGSIVLVKVHKSYETMTGDFSVLVHFTVTYAPGHSLQLLYRTNYIKRSMLLQ